MLDTATTERNRRFLIVEIAWAAIFTGCVSFNAAFLIRLGGSNLLVSLLSSGAALVNVLFTLWYARFLERRTERKPWIVGSLALVRLGHLALIAVPWLPAYRAEAVVALLMLLTIPAALFATGWVPMLADVVPLEKRARVFGTRNMLMGAGTMATTFVLGTWLRWAPFPLNYQVLYLLAVVASMVSTWYVTRIVMPPTSVPINAARVSWTSARLALREQRPFVNIVLNTFIFNIPVWMATPLQPIYFVRTLGASDAWLGFWIGLVSGGAILGNLIWSRAIERRGAAWVLPRAAVLSSAFYLLSGTFPNLDLILVFAVVAGCINAGVDVSHLSTLLQVCPAQRRATYVGIFTTVMNFGFFLVPLWVAPITSVIGARDLMLVLGGLRLLGALLFTVNPVRAAVAERGVLAVGGR